MRSKYSAKLDALTDTTCEFLLAFIRKHPESDMTTIQKNIVIENNILNSKIDILREAALISNHSVIDENSKKVINRLFSLTEEGKQSLSELGY